MRFKSHSQRKAVMAKLCLVGKRPYIKRMEKHLKKEHPSTRDRMMQEPPKPMTEPYGYKTGYLPIYDKHGNIIGKKKVIFREHGKEEPKPMTYIRPASDFE